MRDVALFLLTGLATGVCSGIFGVGGGIVLVPILVLVFGLSQTAATGTSLVALLLPVGLLGVLNYYHAEKITGMHIKMGLIIAVGIFLGTYVGSIFSVAVSAATLRKMFSLLLLVVAVRLWWMR